MQRILIVKLSAIGDVVFASPLIKAIRRTYPHAEISWLVEPPAAPLIQHHTELAEVMVWDKAAWKRLWRERRWFQLWREIRAFRQKLREGQFDLVLDVQGLVKSSVMAWLTAAPRRIGFVAKEKNGLFLTRQLQKRADTRRIASEYLGFAEDIGLDTREFEMDIALSEADRSTADTVAAAGPYAVICPFTTRPQKHWFDDYWRELAKVIEGQLGFRVLMLGGPGDSDHGDILAGGTDIDNRVGQFRLSASAAVISQASLLVGVDTGLTHMGIAFDVPTVALFGSTCPYSDTTRQNAQVIYHGLSCSPCRRRPTCGGRFDCLRQITPQEVMAVATGLLRSPSQP